MSWDSSSVVWQKVREKWKGKKGCEDSFGVWHKWGGGMWDDRMLANCLSLSGPGHPPLLMGRPSCCHYSNHLPASLYPAKWVSKSLLVYFETLLLFPIQNSYPFHLTSCTILHSIHSWSPDSCSFQPLHLTHQPSLNTSTLLIHFLSLIKSKHSIVTHKQVTLFFELFSTLITRQSLLFYFVMKQMNTSSFHHVKWMARIPIFPMFRQNEASVTEKWPFRNQITGH